MRHPMVSSLLPALALAGLVLLAPPVAGQPSALTIGLGAFTEASLDDAGGLAMGLGLSGAVGWRRALPAGYLSLGAAAELGGFPEAAEPFADVEALEAQLALWRGAHRLELAAAVGASALGTPDADPFVRPAWSIRYRLDPGRRAVRPFIGHRGWLLREEGADDVAVGVLEAGFTHRPSVRLGYSLALEGGLEHRPESPLLDVLGSPLEQMRRDWTLGLAAGADGLLGYLVDWRLEAAGGMRWSNANRWLAAPVSLLEEDSESRWEARGEASLAWSPSRQVSLKAGLSLLADLYLQRQALDAAGFPSSESLRVFTLRPQIGLDWTGNDRLYLQLSGRGDFSFSNDPAESGWELSLRGGVEVRL